MMDSVSSAATAASLSAHHMLVDGCGERTSGRTESGHARLCVLERRMPDGTRLHAVFMNHSCDPEGAQFRILHEHWRGFSLRVPDPADRVIVNEGRPLDIGEASAEEAFARFGERGLLAWFARETGTRIVSGEPPRLGLRGLERLFEAQAAGAAGDQSDLTPDLAFYYYMARVIPQYVRSHAERPDFREYMEAWVDERRSHLQESSWFADVEFSYEHFVDLHNGLYPQWPISLEDAFEPDEALAEFLFQQTTLDGVMDTPEGERTPCQRLMLVVNAERDDHLNQVYQDFLDAGVHVFSSYGYPHGEEIEARMRPA